MLDLKFIRENRDLVERAARQKNARVDLDAILSMDEERRRLLGEVDALRHDRNRASEEVNRLKKAGQDASELINRVRGDAERVKELEGRLREVEAKLFELASYLPNIPAPDVPEGTPPDGNVVVRSWGEAPRFDFKPLPHYELAERLGLIDFKAAGRMTGSFFALYTGLGARLERALINFMLDRHRAEGYREIAPPLMVNRRSMFNTGQLPKLEADMYRVESEDFFLIPTAEVPVTNLHQDAILSEEQLPLCYTAFTPCFRLEAGAYGKDTRGLMRLHQFDKVEMVKFCRPEDSGAEHEKLTADAEAVLQALELPYRVVLLCTGDLSFAGSKCYDLEAWAPGVDRFLEVSSCSNFEDFQARRCNTRYRSRTGEVRLVHTLNGSGVALARTVACLLETHQRQDGSVLLPAALRPYLDNLEAITPSE